MALVGNNLKWLFILIVLGAIEVLIDVFVDLQIISDVHCKLLINK